MENTESIEWMREFQFQRVKRFSQTDSPLSKSARMRFTTGAEGSNPPSPTMQIEDSLGTVSPFLFPKL